MSRILIIDGNEADRAATAQALAAVGHEVEQAPDGVEAFENLLAVPCDAIVAEAELPRLPLADLLGRLRGRGIDVPVVVLSHVTKASAVAALLKLGIAGYVPKGSPPAALQQKLAGLLRAAAPAADDAATTGAVTASVLLVTGAEVEHERLRQLCPPSIRVDACPGIKEGLARGRNGEYRMVLLDADAAVVNLGGVVAQMQVLQKEAAIVAIAKAKNGSDDREVARATAELGFDDFLLRPFQPQSVGLLCEHYCAPWNELVVHRDDLIRVSRLRCRPDQRERYLQALAAGLEAALAPLSEACYERAFVDLTGMSKLVLVTDAAALIAQVEQAARALGVELSVALPPAIAADMTGIDESVDKHGFRWFTSVEAARASAG
ncbi:MAG TPA: response regulator [Polyangia bacterium]|nr:response regulator [Polyangia bacterium]